MIVVFDTNVWKSQVYLQSPQAAAVRFYLQHIGAKVGLPEVIKREVTSHLKKDVRKLISGLKSDYGRLLGIVGTLKELVLPDNIDFTGIADRLFATVGVPIVDVSFSFPSAEASFNKIIEGLPPSRTDQQFKDGVIWADCISLLQANDVILVTNDRAFYEDQQIDKGLASALALEIAGLPHKFTILSELGKLLKDIRGQVTIDHEQIASSWQPMLSESVRNLLSNNGYRLGELIKTTPRLFATEQPTILFIEFHAEYNCPALDEAAAPAVLTIGGDCRYNSMSKTVDQFRPQREELIIPLPDGTETRKNVILAASTVYLGHRNISHTARFELSED